MIRRDNRRLTVVRDDMLQLAKAIDALTRFMRPENLKPEFVAANELVTEAAKVVADPLTVKLIGVVADVTVLPFG